LNSLPISTKSYSVQIELSRKIKNDDVQDSLEAIEDKCTARCSWILYEPSRRPKRAFSLRFFFLYMEYDGDNNWVGEIENPQQLVYDLMDYV
jgi:hypothetical protein